MKVKICGITNLEDARAAESAGADFLGFIFEASSPRSVSVEDAAGIISKLSGTAKTVGVFVESDADFIRRAALECWLFALHICHKKNIPLRMKREAASFFCKLEKKIGRYRG